MGSVCDQYPLFNEFNAFQISSRDFKINCAKLQENLMTVEEEDDLINAKYEKKETFMMEEERKEENLIKTESSIK